MEFILTHDRAGDGSNQWPQIELEFYNQDGSNSLTGSWNAEWVQIARMGQPYDVNHAETVSAETFDA